MKILIDTNVLLDYLTMREPFFTDANTVLALCADGAVTGCMAAHSVINAFYILRKLYTPAERRQMLLCLCEVLSVIGLEREKIVSALEQEKFTDFEDCLQAECAEAFGAAYIVTRNVKDFTESRIPAIMPADFLHNIEQEQFS